MPTDIHTYRQTDKYADTLIAIFRTTTECGVTMHFENTLLAVV